MYMVQGLQARRARQCAQNFYTAQGKRFAISHTVHFKKSLQGELCTCLARTRSASRSRRPRDYSVTVTCKKDELAVAPTGTRCQFRQQSESAIRRRKLEERMHGHQPAIHRRGSSSGRVMRTSTVVATAEPDDAGEAMAENDPSSR